MPILREDERLGTCLDKYRLVEIIGKGGMGVVYAARHEVTGRRVAVKVLKNDLIESETARERFIREARAAASLEHPNVVDVLDLGEEEGGDGAVYIVLELLRGERLDRLIHQRGVMPPALLVAIMLPIIDALAKAHGKGIIHRDLKPENVFLLAHSDDSVTPKLLDFGIAHFKHGNTLTKLTQTGSVLGTPQYMSPEQARGEMNAGESIDIWATGVILFEALTGHPPFEGPTTAVVMSKLLNERAPLVRSRAPEVPPALATAIDKALEPKAKNRYQSMAELAEALQAAVAEAGLEIPLSGSVVSGISLSAHIVAEQVGAETYIDETPRPAPKRNLHWIGGALVLSAGLIGGVGFGLMRQGDVEQPAEVISSPPPSAAASETPPQLALQPTPLPADTAPPETENTPLIQEAEELPAPMSPRRRARRASRQEQRSAPQMQAPRPREEASPEAPPRMSGLPQLRGWE